MKWKRKMSGHLIGFAILNTVWHTHTVSRECHLCIHVHTLLNSAHMYVCVCTWVSLHGWGLYFYEFNQPGFENIEKDCVWTEHT
jgi:hypothetical protein